MNLRYRIVFRSVALSWPGSASAARAVPLLGEAGQTSLLREGVILNGDDLLDVRGTADKPSVLVGNRHCIRSGSG